MKKLTQEDIKRASEKAERGRIIPPIGFRKAMEAANRALQFIPLAKRLNPNIKKELKKIIKGGKK